MCQRAHPARSPGMWAWLRCRTPGTQPVCMTTASAAAASSISSRQSSAVAVWSRVCVRERPYVLLQAIRARLQEGEALGQAGQMLTWFSSTSTLRKRTLAYSGFSLRATKMGPIIWQGPHLRRHGEVQGQVCGSNQLRVLQLLAGCLRSCDKESMACAVCCSPGGCEVHNNLRTQTKQQQQIFIHTLHDSTQTALRPHRDRHPDVLKQRHVGMQPCRCWEGLHRARHSARSLTTLSAFSAIILSHAVLSETVITRPPPMLILGCCGRERVWAAGGRSAGRAGTADNLSACRGERVSSLHSRLPAGPAAYGVLQGSNCSAGARGRNCQCIELPKATHNSCQVTNTLKAGRKAVAVACPCRTRCRQHLLSSWPCP